MFLSRLRLLAIALPVIVLSGCLPRVDQAFSNDPNTPVRADKTVFLMTATIKNTYRPSHQPKMLSTLVEKETDKVPNTDNNRYFKSDALGKTESDSPETGSSYLIRMELEKGEYVLRGIPALSSSFPIHGYFFVPIHAKLISATPGVYYLGHVEANVRERKGNEFRAGNVIPLIDQAIAGAGGGTFDVAITDQWVTDEEKFRKKFPALGATPIQMAVLPEFDRQYVQKWWEDH
ncbi:hypothetical protein [Herbaspirillum rhizosphaerae]|uniref:hypothetical protein n=1 Tax=Herbaspirillum rhizosphaerae TaxID=346179 RepID=UPI00067D6A3B|nr:hypothetical protein [Herbaspirillum rhizosphaerae]